MSDPRWNAGKMPQLTGRVAVVTGANSGLGWTIALNLAKCGAHVVLACRDIGKAQRAAQAIHDQVPAASLAHQSVDLSSLSSVRACAAALTHSLGRLDLLINNAGVMFLPYRQSVDGFEIQMASNHLGHFLLTGLLLDLLKRTEGARVVTMSSGFGQYGRLPQDTLRGQVRYSKYRAYCDSKLANLVFAKLLAERLACSGADVISAAAHPGYAATNLQFGAAGQIRSPLWAGANRVAMRVSNALFAQPAAMGALPALYAATSPDVSNGDYIGPDGCMEARGYPTQARVPKQALDKARADRFWALSEQGVGFAY